MLPEADCTKCIVSRPSADSNEQGNICKWCALRLFHGTVARATTTDMYRAL